MQTIPTFRSDAEADLYAERHRPFAHALTQDGDASLAYAERYGLRAAQAAFAGRQAALDDDHRLHLSMIALSHRLFNDRPELFDKPGRSRRGELSEIQPVHR